MLPFGDRTASASNAPRGNYPYEVYYTSHASSCQAMFTYTVHQQQHPQPLSGAYINRLINRQDLDPPTQLILSRSGSLQSRLQLVKGLFSGQLLVAYDPGRETIQARCCTRWVDLCFLRSSTRQRLAVSRRCAGSAVTSCWSYAQQQVATGLETCSQRRCHAHNAE